MELPSTFDTSIAVRQSLVYVVAFCGVFGIFSYTTGGSVALGVGTGLIMASVVIAYFAWSGELGTSNDAD